MPNYLTRDFKDFDTRGSKSNTINPKKQPKMSQDTLMQVRRYLELERRSHSLVQSGIIDQKEHDSLFNDEADFNFKAIEFHLSVAEKRSEHLKSSNFQLVPELPPGIAEAAKRAAEQYSSAWKRN